MPGALVYVTTQEGLWGTAEESIRFYQKVTESLPGKEVIITDDQEKQLKATIEKVRRLNFMPYLNFLTLNSFFYVSCECGLTQIMYL